MFGKFGLHLAHFDALVSAVNEPGVSALFRWQGFLRYVADAVRFFEYTPSLRSIKLVSTVRPEFNLERDVVVCLRHHFKVATEGGTIGMGIPEAVDAYVLSTLPYHTMGAGVFELSRMDPAVQVCLQLTGTEDELYMAQLNELAQRMDLAFGLVRVQHDLGLASAG